ncbi:hypothetical protein Nans01_30040 [Nocardiopsis ansamitocini]|uniref:Uncharacterized protein n=1 Tax=Nocardiopsis ansamitocini TaxID=1670832 RepID=A0A9W6P7Y8_9ACTN|nr:hypothetical protein Nans01_30040 [Nocardiopsis ansamitocini]
MAAEEAGGGAAGQGEPGRGQYRAQPLGPAAASVGQACHLFDEGPPTASGVRAQKPADPKAKAHR